MQKSERIDFRGCEMPKGEFACAQIEQLSMSCPVDSDITDSLTMKLHCCSIGFCFDKEQIQRLWHVLSEMRVEAPHLFE
jgi:hypothetical protein